MANRYQNVKPFTGFTPARDDWGVSGGDNWKCANHFHLSSVRCPLPTYQRALVEGWVPSRRRYQKYQRTRASGMLSTPTPVPRTTNSGYLLTYLLTHFGFRLTSLLFWRSLQVMLGPWRFPKREFLGIAGARFFQDVTQPTSVSALLSTPHHQQMNAQGSKQTN